jgi:hypothetical protein
MLNGDGNLKRKNCSESDIESESAESLVDQSFEGFESAHDEAPFEISKQKLRETKHNKT